MRKLLSLFILISLFQIAQAQIEVGIMFAPNISINRIDGVDKDGKVSDFVVDKNQAGMRFSAGPTVDLFLSDNIAVSTGVFFTLKRSSVTFSYDSSGSSTFDPVVNIQYVQIPVALKMYTNEIMSRTKLYFKLGGTLDTRIAENLQNDQDVNFDEEFSRLLDAGLYLGAGIEKGIGKSNKVFAAVTYNRGLINVITKDFHEAVNRENDFVINNDLLSLVAGFKF